MLCSFEPMMIDKVLVGVIVATVPFIAQGCCVMKRMGKRKTCMCHGATQQRNDRFPH